MPYILRDQSGTIIKASARQIVGGEGVGYDNPDLVAYIEARGLQHATIQEYLTELKKTDNDMVRAIEDVITALLKKNILKLTDLPKPVQDKIAQRTKLRAMIAEAYDRASMAKVSS
ncbi:MAG: hypothetical protein EBZ69_09250 [Alphaproteobacteria bacterium]|nr:hypothetical protein [Alphaproteobacteria bacterium]NDC56967.1 hypothetical protein [Alphaproteobacteria bacterium]NDG04291.1 hypothetical protein [Alphaproteobacteria bacterium]